MKNSGVLVKNAAGEKMMTVAVHGFEVGGYVRQGVSHPTNIGLSELKPGVKFENKIFAVRNILRASWLPRKSRLDEVWLSTRAFRGRRPS